MQMPGPSSRKILNTPIITQVIKTWVKAILFGGGGEASASELNDALTLNYQIL